MACSSSITTRRVGVMGAPDGGDLVSMAEGGWWMADHKRKTVVPLLICNPPSAIHKPPQGGRATAAVQKLAPLASPGGRATAAVQKLAPLASPGGRATAAVQKLAPLACRL